MSTGILHSSFSCFGGYCDIALNKQAAIVVNLETLVRNWVVEGVLFYDEYDTNLLRY